jgi:hypothetical protein
MISVKSLVKVDLAVFKALIVGLVTLLAPLQAPQAWYDYSYHPTKAGVCVSTEVEEEMSIDKNQLRDSVVVPVLKVLDLYSDSAVNLLMGTAAVESNLGEYITQIGGPARGVFQMEPATHDDIVKHYLHYKPDLVEKIKEATGVNSLDSRHLTGNLYYAAAFARIHYLRVPKPLPNAGDLIELASYWKDYYNTKYGKGTTAKFINKYERYVV